MGDERDSVRAIMDARFEQLLKLGCTSEQLFALHIQIEELILLAKKQSDFGRDQ
jgi:hypothetical protein